MTAPFALNRRRVLSNHSTIVKEWKNSRSFHTAISAHSIIGASYLKGVSMFRLLVCFTAVLAVSRASLAISGGHDVAAADPLSRSVATLQSTWSDGSHAGCTATFISKSVLVTAAHCLFEENNNPIVLKRNQRNQMFISLRSYDFDRPKREAGYWAPVLDYEIAPSATISDSGYISKDDVALLKIDPSYLRVQTVPMRLPSFTSAPVPSDRFFIAGFGPNDSGPEWLFKLRTMSISAVGKTTNENMIKVNFDSDPKNEGAYVGLNHGDSGGPIFTQYGRRMMIIGVNSGPSTYSSLLSVQPWLMETWIRLESNGFPF